MCRVRVLVAREHVQLAIHATTEHGLGQHALDGDLDHALGMLFEELAESDRLDAADGAGVVVVDLVGHLGAGHAHLLGVDDHDVIAHVDVRAVVGLVLALEAQRNFRCQTTEGFALGVNEIPVAANRRGLRKNSAHLEVSVRGPPPEPEGVPRVPKRARECTEGAPPLQNLLAADTRTTPLAAPCPPGRNKPDGRLKLSPGRP